MISGTSNKNILRGHRPQKTLTALKIQIRVIKALYLRELITHFGRHNLGFLWMFIEPMMFSVGITILWTYGGHNYHNLSVAGFALTGYSSIVAWRNCVGRTAYAINANHGLLYHRNITIFDIALTRAIFEISAVTVSISSLTILFWALDLMQLPNDPLQAVLAWLLLGWFFICIGFVAVYLKNKSELFDRIWHVLMYLTLPLTGAFFMLDWVPKASWVYLSLSPMLHGVEMLREAYFGSAVKAHYSIKYLVTCNIFLTFFSLLLLNRIKKSLTLE
jgi:ABC-type polysaccharide/polyol phosphate export permease